jgi:hypothetical protein
VRIRNAGPFAVPAIDAVIGSYADYYSEWDGMVEFGAGASERLQARILAGETASETRAANRASLIRYQLVGQMDFMPEIAEELVAL